MMPTDPPSPRHPIGPARASRPDRNTSHPTPPFRPGTYRGTAPSRPVALQVEIPVVCGLWCVAGPQSIPSTPERATGREDRGNPRPPACRERCWVYLCPIRAGKRSSHSSHSSSSRAGRGVRWPFPAFRSMSMRNDPAEFPAIVLIAVDRSAR
jgi:hypothetical protein